MTILKHFIPVDGQWSNFFDRGYIPYHWDPRGQWSDWQQRGVEIPIQYFGRHPLYHDTEQEFSSDSDEADDFYVNMNNNSGRIRRRRRQSTSSHKLISPSDFLLDTDIVEPKSNGVCKQKQGNDKSSSKNSSLVVSDRTLRSREKKSEEKQVVFIDESDIENEVNETSNYSVYKYLKGFLASSDRQIDAIKGDGNCFFRALSKVIFGSQVYYSEMRKQIVELIEKYPKRFEAFTDSPVPLHVSDMRQDKTWATQAEIYAAATLLNRDIYILSPDQCDDNYRWLLFSPQFQNTADLPVCSCYLTLCHTHGNHYDRVVAKSGKCNCTLEPPELSGITESLDLTNDFIEIV